MRTESRTGPRGIGYTVALMIWLFFMGGLIGNKIGHAAANANCATKSAGPK